MIGKSAMSLIYPATRTAKHYLFEIDRDKKTAYCSACGWTEIHIPTSRSSKNPKIYCIKRFQELRDAERDKRHSQPGWKPRHALSEINPVTRTAICSVCGSTRIWKRNVKGSVYYHCATNYRAYVRKYHRNRYSSNTSKPNAHALSQIDEEKKTAVCSKCGPVTIYIWQGRRKMGRRCSNAPVNLIPGAREIRREINTNIIDRYKLQKGCKKCGDSSDPLRLTLYNRGRISPIKIERILTGNSNILMQKLANWDVLCASCRNPDNHE